MNDKYLQYDTSDFITDDAFVNWVLDGTDNDLWREWLSKNESHTTIIEDAAKTIQNLKFKDEAIGNTVKNDLWKRIEQSTETKEISLAPKRRWLYGLTAAAAIIILAIAILPKSEIRINNQKTSNELVMLPSNSQVDLTTSSKISYKKGNWSNRRDVKLSGEAHFKVSKGVPFSVITDNGSVKVLGTEFDVVSESDAFLVNVTEGRVSITSDNYNKVLTAGMSFYKNPIIEGTNRIKPSWKTQNMFFTFRDQPLNEVLEAFTFSYDYNFQLNNVNTEQKFTGFFDSSADLATSLQQILWTMNIDFNIEDDVIRLSQRN